MCIIKIGIMLLGIIYVHLFSMCICQIGIAMCISQIVIAMCIMSMCISQIVFFYVRQPDRFFSMCVSQIGYVHQ